VRQPGDASLAAGMIGFLDPAEAEAIALALELNALLLLDERRARKKAAELGLWHIGTGGILLDAKQVGLLSEVHPLLNAMRKAGVYFGDRLIRDILRLAGEND
jgi:hypothetical protein